MKEGELEVCERFDCSQSELPPRKKFKQQQPPQQQQQLAFIFLLPRMRIVLKCPEKPKEWLLIELQGTIESKKADLRGKELGQFFWKNVRFN
jgi:hypothetical protein